MAISKYEKDDKSFYEVFVKTRDPHGKQKATIKRGFKTLKEARDAELNIRLELRAFKNKIVWQDFVAQFLESSRPRYRPSTYVGYKSLLDKWVNRNWHNKFIDEITSGDVHTVLFERMSGVSNYTQKNVLKVIKRALQYGVENNLLNRNPAVGVNVKVSETKQAALNHDEISIFLHAAKAARHKYYPHWTVALLTGMRSGELQALRWTDVDFTSNSISITKSWTRLNGEGPTKSSRNRICPISEEAKWYLQGLRAETGQSEYVLPRDPLWERGNLSSVTRDFCRGLGISEVKFHDLRATFITQLLKNGVSTSKVMAIVGHSSLKTTETYLRLCGKDVEGATEALNIILPKEDGFLGKVIELKR